MSKVAEPVNGAEASRPWMPASYGVSTTEEGMLSWAHVTGLLSEALNYWIATTSENGRPHVRPAWGAWLDGTLYFDGDPATGWVRNILRDPRISVQIEAGDEAAILEGSVVDIAHADENLASRLAEAFGVKYSGIYKNYTPDPDAWRERGLLSMRPDKAFAWRVAEFSRTRTRWRFNYTGSEER